MPGDRKQELIGQIIRAEAQKQFTPELCQKMHDAGFRLLFLGLESGCDRVLQLMKKGTEKVTAAQVCRNVREAGIWSHLYVFLGFPGETRDEAMETAEFLRVESCLKFQGYWKARGRPRHCLGCG